VTERVVVLVAESSEGKGTYVAVFNRGSELADVHYTWKELGLPRSEYVLRDLWGHLDAGKADGVTVKLEPHACRLYLAKKVN